jgi:hypothetical protein
MHPSTGRRVRDDGGVRTSETSANFYQTTRRKIPEDSHLRCYNPKTFLDESPS